eukprot:3429539-Rhodomonas_salina.3
MCRQCHGDEVYIENPVQICDFCCTGIHLKCQEPPRQGDHGFNPLQNDTAWFCSDECETAFKALMDKIQLPPDYTAKKPSGSKMEGKNPISFTIKEQVCCCLAPRVLRVFWY